jgi:hypothetical protein
MTVTVTDNRTTLDEADSLTGWSSPSGAGLTLTTTNPAPVELTGCIGMGVSTATEDLVHGFTAADLTSTLIYVWVLPLGQMDTVANGGVALVLGDGTDLIGYHLAGSDGTAFRHETGPVVWQCLLLDTAALPASFTVQAGAEANLTLTAITQIGALFTTLSKALGGGDNCYTDVIRYGNGGLTITAGTSGAPGLFSEIVAADLSDTSTQAYGIIRELGVGLYGCQGPLVFGDSAGTAATFFADTNGVMQFEDRNIGTDKYSITVQGNATGSTTFQLGLPSGATGGTDGYTLSCPAGVGAEFIATDADLQFLLIYGSTLRGFENGVTLSTDATNAPNHEIFATLFSGNGQITPGLTQFQNNRIVGAILTSTEGAILFPSADDDIEDLTFTIGVEGHAVRVASTGTYELRDFFFNGYSASLAGATFNTETQVNGTTEVVTTVAAHGFVTEEPVVLNDDGGTETIGLTEGTVYYVRALTTTTLSFHTSAANAASDTARVDLTASGVGNGEVQSLYSANASIINDSAGAVTIDVVRGDTPSIRNVGAATTTVNNNVQVSLTGLKENTEVRVYATGTTTPELAGIENAVGGGGVDDRTFAFSLESGLAVDIRIFAVAYEPADLVNFSMVAGAIPIQQRFDRTFLNP